MKLHYSQLKYGYVGSRNDPILLRHPNTLEIHQSDTLAKVFLANLDVDY